MQKTNTKQNVSLKVVIIGARVKKKKKKQYENNILKKLKKKNCLQYWQASYGVQQWCEEINALIVTRKDITR